jgi:ankyrin repeat protein
MAGELMGEELQELINHNQFKTVAALTKQYATVQVLEEKVIQEVPIVIYIVQQLFALGMSKENAVACINALLDQNPKAVISQQDPSTGNNVLHAIILQFQLHYIVAFALFKVIQNRTEIDALIKHENNLGYSSLITWILSTKRPIVVAARISFRIPAVFAVVLTQPDKEGLFPFHHIMNLMVEQKLYASIWSNFMDLCGSVLASEREEDRKVLLRQRLFNPVNKQGQTPHMLLARIAKENMYQSVIKNGTYFSRIKEVGGFIDFSAIDNAGNNITHYAVKASVGVFHLIWNVIEELDVTLLDDLLATKNNEGEVPFLCALQYSALPEFILTTLLDAMPRIEDIVNNIGITPIMAACIYQPDKNFIHLVNHLREYYSAQEVEDMIQKRDLNSWSARNNEKIGTVDLNIDPDKRIAYLVSVVQEKYYTESQSTLTQSKTGYPIMPDTSIPDGQAFSTTSTLPFQRQASCLLMTSYTQNTSSMLWAMPNTTQPFDFNPQSFPTHSTGVSGSLGSGLVDPNWGDAIADSWEILEHIPTCNTDISGNPEGTFTAPMFQTDNIGLIEGNLPDENNSLGIFAADTLPVVYSTGTSVDHGTYYNQFSM